MTIHLVIWILCILLLLALVFQFRKEGFQIMGSQYVLPAPQSPEYTKAMFWSIVGLQKSATSGSGSGSGSGSNPTLDLLNKVTNPADNDTFKMVFPNYISIYALSKYNKDAKAARYALTYNYDELQGELNTQVTKDEDKQAAIN